MKIIKHPLLIIALIVFPALTGLDTATAQPGGGPPPDPPCWPPPCTIPIDGGIGFLIAAGIAYGGKKIIDSKKNPA